jgi:hypothetical protein
MMLKKKVALGLLSTMVVLGSPFVPVAEKAMAADKGATGKINLVYVLEGVVPSDADEELLNVLRDTDWVIEGKKMTKRLQGRQMDVQIKGQKLKTDKNGEMVVRVNGDEETVDLIDDIAGTDLKVKVKKGKTVTVEKKIDFHALLAGMGDHSTENVGQTSDHNYQWLTDGEAGYHYRAVHCNRFNGYQGNGRYYADKTSSQAVQNFAKSDCDWALALWTTACLADYGPAAYTYCGGEPQAKNGHCSDWGDINPTVEHARYFHMHTSPDAPIN